MKKGLSISAEQDNPFLRACTPAGAGIPEKIEGMPLTDVLLVNIKLLTLQELKLITEKGAEGRRKLNELFIGPERLVSSLTRPSVV